MINPAFVDELRFPARGLRVVMIQSDDGSWIDASGSSRGLSSQFDLEWMLWNRASADLLLISGKTAKAERYKQSEFRKVFADWREHEGLPQLLAICALTGQPNLALEMLEQGFLVLSLNAFDFSHERLIIAENLTEGIQRLNEKGYFRIVCEGGPGLTNSLIEENLVDEFALTSSPVKSPSSERYRHIEKFLSTQEPRYSLVIDGFTFTIFGRIARWNEQLEPLAYEVLRNAATEAPYSTEYETRASSGYYTCRACGNRLFDASTQFDSHCGWPAFWRPSATDRVVLEIDVSHGMRRIEVKCGACYSHLGHVFEGEGFGFPTDQRYCINKITLVRHH